MKNILYTRLIRPKSNRNQIKREELNKQIEEILDNKVTILKGGPAVGKTTLISQYLESKDNYIWVSLDEESNDNVYFWTYIIHAFENKLKDSKLYIDMLGPISSRNEIFNLIPLLINELITEESLILVLDDFHYINDEVLLSSIEYFIKNTSSNVHFVIISREDIPIYLGDVMIDEGVLEVEGDSFKLSLAETIGFVNNTLKKNFSNDTIEGLYKLTEGWIGAIQLILSINKTSNELIKLPKDSKYFMDYISKEIIEGLSSKELEFLVKTAPLKYIDSKVGYRIIKEFDENLIEKLIMRNMLVITIDEENKIYRYHNVLREYLLKVFKKIEPSEKTIIINNLIDYLIAEENYDEALRLTIDSRFYAKAVEIISQYAHKLISFKVINDIPLEYYKKSLDLTIISIFHSYLMFDIDKGREIIASLGEMINEGTLKCVKVYKLLIELDNIKIDEDDFCLEIKENINPMTKLIYYTIISFGYRFIGKYGKCIELAGYIEAANKELKNNYIELFSLYDRVSLLEEMGRLREGLEEYKKLEGLIKANQYNKTLTIFFNIGLPGIYIKRMELDNAKKLLLEAEETSKSFKEQVVFNNLDRSIKYNLVEVLFLEGNIKECEEVLDFLISIDKDNVMYLYSFALKIRLFSNIGKLKKSDYSSFINEYKMRYNKSYDYTSMVNIAHSICLYNLGHFEAAKSSIENTVFQNRKNSVGYTLIYALIWDAIISYNDIKNKRNCLNMLKEAIYYSKEEEIFMPFYVHYNHLKNIIADLKDDLYKDEDNKNFLQRLVKFTSEDKKTNILSEREQEVLAAMSSGLSNKEIGEKLFISISTVKTHLINIYSKLGVKNRVEAIKQYEAGHF